MSDVENYIAYVQRMLSRFKETGDLIRENDVAVDKINKALAGFYNVSLALSAEYQRAKIEEKNLQLEFESKWDTWFSDARTLIRSMYKGGDKTIKPAVKEYEIQARMSNRDEYDEYQSKITVAEAKTQFLLRLRETLNKMDSILVTLSANMRTEMKSLSIETRGQESQAIRTRQRERA
jgi:hypothetical protein